MSGARQMLNKVPELTLYWLAVVLLSIVGTLITDNLTDNLGVSLVTTTVLFSVMLAATVDSASAQSERVPCSS